MRLQLSRNGAVWRYPHASIGLVMLIGVFFQPWLGYVHHKIFKRRLDAINAGATTKKLGRTIITQVHIWLGRFLITVGVINGGLGIMVTRDRGDSLQSMETSKRAAIAYATIAGTFFLAYAAFMLRHECRRAPLILNVTEGGSSSEGSSTTSDKSIQSIEIGRKFSVFSEEVPELSERDRSKSRGRRGSSNDKLKLVSGQPARAHSPKISPIEEVKMP
jgi:hypothetical protein